MSAGAMPELYLLPTTPGKPPQPQTPSGLPGRTRPTRVAKSPPKTRNLRLDHAYAHPN